MNQPLNISIMGEFKAGKSTFINALLGKKIAPMGVTPTTATLNFFKYGKENKIKLIKMDNSFEELEIKDISKYTDERVLDKEKIESINYLEIFLDWEKLKEINIIDTPGLNAGIKRHEDITHEFIKKSDIIIWVFDVEQAGKQSEKIFFEKIKSYSKHTIAVINGIDKVDEKEEVDEVINYIKSSLGSFFDQVIAVSAKKALYAKIDNITKNYAESGFIELESCLENNIYSKISKIKIDNIFYDMKELFNEIETSINIEKTKNLEIITKSELIKNYVLNFEKELIKTEFIIKSKLKTELDLLILKLAKDIKSFIKPTQGIIESVFGKNKFENEEKEFTISKLKTGLKNLFISYNNDLKTFMEEKSTSLINTIFAPKTRKIFLQLDNDFFKHDNSNYDFFEFYSIQKNGNIYNEIINPSYYYYLGFIDSGSINNFFNVISNETDLSEEKIHKTLLKFLPDIFENLNNSFIIWKKSYFNFIDIFIENILKNINDEFFNINTEIFDQLIFLKEEISNLENN